jgi:hypothetical protein
MDHNEPELLTAKPPGNRPCCDEDYCVRKYLDQIAEPEAPIVQRIQAAACEVARTCHNLRAEDLHVCAGRLFGLTPECDLTSLFVLSYGIERDAMEGKQQIEERGAAGFARSG